MGPLVFLVLLLAVPLVLQFKGRNVSAQLFAIALVTGLAPQFMTIWQAMDWTGSIDAALSRHLFGFEPSENDRTASYGLIFAQIPAALALFAFAAIGVIARIQESLNPPFFRRTKTVAFWAIVFLWSHMVLYYARNGLGQAVFRAWRQDESLLGTHDLSNSFIGYAFKRDLDYFPTMMLGVFCTLVFITVLSIVGILASARRNPDPRS